MLQFSTTLVLLRYYYYFTAGLATGPDYSRPRRAAAPLTAPRYGLEVMVMAKAVEVVGPRAAREPVSP